MTLLPNTGSNGHQPNHQPAIVPQTHNGERPKHAQLPPSSETRDNADPWWKAWMHYVDAITNGTSGITNGDAAYDRLDGHKPAAKKDRED